MYRNYWVVRAKYENYVKWGSKTRKERIWKLRNLYSIGVHVTTVVYKNWRVCNFIAAI